MIETLHHLRAVRHTWRQPGATIADLQDPFRVLLLGEDNPQSPDVAFTLYPSPPGVAGDRLMRILGLRRPTYLSLWRANLCCPSWSTREARAHAAKIRAEERPQWSTIVLLGRKVADAWGYDRPPFTWSKLGDVTVASIPHPSGLNHEWYDPTATELARLLLARVAPSVPWGEAA